MERPPRAAPRGRWVVWLLVWGGWTALAIFFAAASSLTFIASYQPPRWGQTMTLAFAEWYVWAALTPLVVWLAGRFPFGACTWLRSGLVHAPSGARDRGGESRAHAHPARDRGRRAGRLHRDQQSGDPVRRLLVDRRRRARASTYYRAGRERELRASQLEARLAEARLQLLKMQLQPHFLYNALNTISELVLRRARDFADRMITHLGELLRVSLEAGGHRPGGSPSRQEVDFLERCTWRSRRSALVSASPRGHRIDPAGV